MTDEDKEPKTTVARRILAGVLMGIYAIGCMVYVILVACNKIEEKSRLKGSELAMALASAVFLLLVLYPEALDSLSLVSLPGGVKLTLRKLKRQQKQQDEALDIAFRVISTKLLPDEKYYLKDLAKESPVPYVMTPTLRERLVNLRRLGLIEEVKGQSIEYWLDNNSENPKTY